MATSDITYVVRPAACANKQVSTKPPSPVGQNDDEAGAGQQSESSDRSFSIQTFRAAVVALALLCALLLIACVSLSLYVCSLLRKLRDSSAAANMWVDDDDEDDNDFEMGRWKKPRDEERLVAAAARRK